MPLWNEGALVIALDASNADAWAYEIAKKSSLGLSEAERQYAVTVARGEGGYGAGWAHPSQATIDLSQQFGLTGYEGAGSNNWGAEQGAGDAGSFRHVDRHVDGSAYVASYRRYSSPEAGFDGFARILFSGNARGAAGAKKLRSAIARGSLHDAVFEQHANGYFELAPESYLKGVLRNYETLAQKTGWASLLSEQGRRGSGKGAGFGWLLIAAGLGVTLFGKKRG